jgi:hypothetical protein
LTNRSSLPQEIKGQRVRFSPSVEGGVGRKKIKRVPIFSTVRNILAEKPEE